HRDPPRASARWPSGSTGRSPVGVPTARFTAARPFRGGWCRGMIRRPGRLVVGTYWCECPLMDPTSASLLDQLRGPERTAAWPRFVRLYTPLLLRWGQRLGVPESDRPDLLQDVFLVLLRTLPAFAYDRGRGFRAWL